MSTEIKDRKTCPGCDKHCPVGQFACGKGRKLFGQVEENTQTDDKRNKNPEPMAGKEHRRGSHNHDKRGHSDHEEHRGHHHNHDTRHDKKRWNEENSDDLTVMMGKCGHHLAKHSGRGHGQDKILRILSEEGSISQRKLQEILDIRPGSVSEILTKLEDKGFIQREKSETDKRAVIIHITQAGEAAAKHADKRPLDAPFACLDEAEKETLRVLLKKLLNVWYGKKQPVDQ